MEASMSFWKELSRRNVVKVGIAYAVAAWLIIHPVDIIFPILHLPEWSITLVAAFLIICFPFVLIFSWVYEVTPKGLKKTKEVPLSKSTAQITGRRLNYLLTGLLIVAIGLLVFDKFYLDRHAIKTEQVPTVSTAAKAKKSIAVVPFVNLSSDKEQESFVDGLSEEMINSITQIPDLRVIARTSSFTFKDSDNTAQEIAKELNVEYILEGSVRKSGNDLRITAQLISAADESHLWSKSYDKKLKDIFTIQEDIATAVANELKITLGLGKSHNQLGGTDNPEAYELYLVAKGQFTGGGDTELALKSVEAALELDPNFALAWELKSECHNNLSFEASPELVASVREAGLRAAQKAIELEPDLASGYVSLAFSKSVSRKFVEAGSIYRKAFEMSSYQSADPNRCSITHYLAVGYINKIKEILEEARKNDPFNKDIRGWYISILAYLDEIQLAEKEYERGKAMFLNDWPVGDIFIYQARIATGNLKSSDTTMSWETTNVAKKHLDSPKEGLTSLYRLYNDKKNLDASTIIEFSQWAAYFGDTDFALDTLTKAIDFNSETISYVWVPIMKEVRKTPRFKKFVKEIGLVDYWNKFGWPDICHKLDNGDFVCD
jgi:adenylate cyclase